MRPPWRTVSLQTAVEAVSTGWLAEQINHRGIANVLVTSVAPEALLMPNETRRFDKASFALQSENRPTADWTVTLGPAMDDETWSTQKPVG